MLWRLFTLDTGQAQEMLPDRKFLSNWAEPEVVWPSKIAQRLEY